MRKAAAVHDPPPVEDPLAILTRSDEVESGIIQHSCLMFWFIIISKYDNKENKNTLIIRVDIGLILRASRAVTLKPFIIISK